MFIAVWNIGVNAGCDSSYCKTEWICNGTLTHNWTRWKFFEEWSNYAHIYLLFKSTAQCKKDINDITSQLVGKCGVGLHSNYLHNTPCSGPYEQLNKYAACDFQVCAEACDGLSVTEDQPWGTVSYMGSTIHCFNSSESDSFNDQDTPEHSQYASDASVAFGCNHSMVSTNTHSGGAYSLVGCYSNGELTWDTQSSVVESNFCYGGLNETNNACPKDNSAGCNSLNGCGTEWACSGKIYIFFQTYRMSLTKLDFSS